MSEKRRKSLLEQLSDVPVSATTLAARLSVSRQVIVSDVALLRAGGAQILATPRGYISAMPRTGITRSVAVRHNRDQLRDELYAIVDCGAEVVNVIVEHAVYGQLTGELHLRTHAQVDAFRRALDASDARPLSQLTDGIHLHELHCPDEACFVRVTRALADLGLLLDSEEMDEYNLP